MGNSEIMAVPNQYKNTLHGFINSLDPKSLNEVRFIYERSYNSPMSKGSFADLLEEDCLDENLSNRSSRLSSKTEDSQVCQRYVIVPQARYEKSQRGKRRPLEK